MATNMKLFLKANKKPVGTQEYAPTASLTDEKGNPLMWTFKPITADELEDIREKYSRNVQVPGKPGQFTQKLNTKKFNAAYIARCVVEPDLQNEELQDSYGVKTPEALLTAMVDLPGEFTDLLVFVNKLCGFDQTLNDSVEEAKNF